MEVVYYGTGIIKFSPFGISTRTPDPSQEHAIDPLRLLRLPVIRLLSKTPNGFIKVSYKAHSLSRSKPRIDLFSQLDLLDNSQWVYFLKSSYLSA